MARALVMGFTFKENVPYAQHQSCGPGSNLARFCVRDRRLRSYHDAEVVRNEYGVVLTNQLPCGPFDAVILAVKHWAITELGECKIKALLSPNGLIYNLKAVLPTGASHAHL